jgi:hypothetical protein
MRAEPLTYDTALDYLEKLGKRFTLIGRSELTYTGEASADSKYPLLLVEGDAPGSEIFDTSRPTGVETFTVSVQVLNQSADNKAATTRKLLAQTNAWADQLTEQLRQERPQQLVNVNKLPLPGQAGGSLATGWRLELTLKIAKEVDRATNKDLFTPEVL